MKPERNPVLSGANPRLRFCDPRVGVLLVTVLQLVTSTEAQCPCPIAEQTICYQCQCELTPDGRLAVNCKDIGLTVVPTFTYTSTAFEEVTLADNQITSIPSEKFKELHALKHLNLQGNQITNVSISAFSGIGDSLEELLLEVQHMTEFPKQALSELSSLKNLTATGFDLSLAGLPDGALATLTHLVQLDLSNNGMRTMTSGALSGQVSSLRELVLDSNSFSTIPTSALATLSALEVLSIASNTGLTRIADGDFQGTQLRSLDLSQNGFTSVDSGAFGGLETTLESLDMRSCHLTDHMLPPLQHLSTLRQLDLSSNQIANIPNYMFSSMHQMQTLQLHQNQIHTLTDTTLVGLTSLESLDLSSNSLASIHVNTFQATPSIRQLILGLNANLSPTLPDGIFEWMASTLEELDLEGTGFNQNHWRLIQNVASLKVLRLTNNQISVLPEMGLEKLRTLKSLYLDSNSLTEVKQEHVYGPNAHLELANFNDNSLRSLDECVFFQFQHIDYYKLGLKDNNLHCDCNLIWLLRKLQQHPEYDFMKYTVAWTCSSPPALNGKKFSYEINETDLVCEDPVTSAPCRDLSPVTTATTTTPPTTTFMPSVPFIFKLNITEVTDTSMLLTWSISNPASDYVLGFRIQYRKMYQGADQNIDLGADIRSYQLTELAPYTPYLVCVTALGIQDTSESVCDSATTEPLSDEISTPKDNTLLIALSCTLGVLLIIAIIAVALLLRHRKKKKAEKDRANPFGIRVGYDSKRFSRPVMPNVSMQNLDSHENPTFSQSMEGFSKEEQNRILGLISKYGASTLSMLSTASSMRYIQDPQPPPGPSRSSCYVVSDNQDNHIYCEIPDDNVPEGAYENDSVDSYLNHQDKIQLTDNTQSGISV